MAQSRELALQQATHTTVRTEWVDERWAIPISQDDHPTAYNSWLQSMGAPTPETWNAIQTNWISFLSATSIAPSGHLAPNRKKVQFTGGTRTAQEREKNRFRTDRQVRRDIQKAIWGLFDPLEGLTERWPHQARLILNRASNQTAAQPFQTLAAKSNWRRRRRINAVSIS